MLPVSGWDNQEFESAVLDVACIAKADVAGVRAGLTRLMCVVWSVAGLKSAETATDRYRRSKIEFYDEYKAAMTALDKALRGYLVVERKLREVLDSHPEMRLEQIDAKLELSRGVSEMEGRAAEWCKQNRDRNSFEIDRERQAHLTIKTAADRETARLKSERRSTLSNPDAEVNAWGTAMFNLIEYAPAEESFIRNYAPERGHLTERVELIEKAEVLKLLSFAPLEQIRQEVDGRLRALSLPVTKEFSRHYGRKKRGRPKGAKTHMNDVREKVVHSLLDAAHRGGGKLTYSEAHGSGTLWPALQRLSICMPSEVVPSRDDPPPWLRDLCESWRGPEK